MFRMKSGSSLKLISWSLYDFANTIFSAVVLTLYFPLLLTSLTDAKWPFGAATTSAMLIAGAVTPFIGAVTDATGKNKAYLVWATIACVFFNSLLGVFRQPAFLIMAFFASCVLFHLCLVLYNSLLPVAAAPEKQGFASGLGVGLGYLGVVCVLPLMHVVHKKFGMPSVFFADALLFLLFSLPLFFFLPERRVENPKPFSRTLIKEQTKRLLELLKGLPGKPKLLLFLGGNFFLVDSVNSTILWFSVFTREIYAPGEKALIAVMMGLNAAAFLAGLLAGFLTDKAGSMRTLLGSAACLCLMLAVLAQDISFQVFAFVSIAGGAFSIAGIWTAGRKVLIELAPVDSIGEYFGLYGLTTKISILGSLFYSLASDAVGMRNALWVLVFPAAAGTLLLFWSSKLKNR